MSGWGQDLWARLCRKNGLGLTQLECQGQPDVGSWPRLANTGSVTFVSVITAVTMTISPRRIYVRVT